MHLLIAALLLGQAADPVKPAAALDPQSPPSVLEHAVFRSRSESSYKTGYVATLKVPKSDPYEYRGTAVFVRPGLLFVDYIATGGDHKRIVRAGEPAWVFHSLADEWVDAAEIGMAGAGKGIQNPDEILAILGTQSAAAAFDKDGALKVALKGAQIAEIMKSQAKQGVFNWEKSSASALIRLDEQGRVKQLGVEAEIFDNEKGAVAYAAQVEVVDYAGTREIAFKDDANKPLALSKPVQEAVDKVLKEKR
jgi:hypothetical protein